MKRKLLLIIRLWTQILAELCKTVSLSTRIALVQVEIWLIGETE